MSKAYFFPRQADGDDDPGGMTVSKHQKLPEGEFGITEFVWGETALWFVDDDKFTADERQFAYDGYLVHRHLTALEDVIDGNDSQTR